MIDFSFVKSFGMGPTENFKAEFWSEEVLAVESGFLPSLSSFASLHPIKKIGNRRNFQEKRTIKYELPFFRAM